MCLQYTPQHPINRVGLKSDNSIIVLASIVLEIRILQRQLPLIA